MGMRSQDDHKKSHRRDREAAEPDTAEVQSSTSGEDFVDEMDDLLDEIDSLLEENAEDFVRSYVQKGGGIKGLGGQG